jgi:hypothetical protein
LAPLFSDLKKVEDLRSCEHKGNEEHERDGGLAQQNVLPPLWGYVLE